MMLIFKLITRLFRWSLWFVAMALVAMLVGILSLTFSTKLPNQLWPYLNDWTDKRIHIGHSTGTLYSGLTLYDLAYQDADIKLHAQKIQWQWSPLAWLRGPYQLNQLSISQLHLDLANTTQSPPSDSTFALNELYALLQQPFRFIYLLPVDIHLEQIQLSDITLSQAGTPLIQVQRLDTQLRWQANQLELNDFNTQLTFQQQTHQAWLSARVFFKNADAFEGDLRLAYAGPPEQAPLHLDAHWEGQLTELKLNLNTHSPIEMQAQHHWSLSPEQLTLSSDWTKIKGQLLDLGHLNIQPSQTHIRYQFADAQLQLQTTLAGQLADWPAGKLQLGLNVIGLHRADQQLTGEMTLLTPQYGELSTQFEIDWINPVFDWRQPHTLHLALQTAQLNLSALHQDWDYQIDSQLHFHLSDLQKRQSHLDIHQLTLHGLTHPLSTQGQISTRLDDHHDYHLEGQLEAIHYDQLALTVRLDAQLAKTLDGITLHQLSFSQADNQLSLNGVLNQQSYQFELDAALNQLSELLSPWGVAGQAHLNLQTQGSVNTDWTHIDQAWLQVQATSDQLQWDDILFHTLQLDADIPLHQPAWGQLNAQLAKITQGEEVVSAALHLKRTVQADGMRNEISLHHPSAQIEMASLERQPNLTHWVFDLERLRITQPQTGIWLLNQPSTLRWNASDQLKLSQSCLGLVSHPNSQICLDAQDHQLNWVLHQLPILEWAAEFIPDHVDIDTQLNAQGFINWQQDLKIQQQILFKQLDLRVTEQGYEWPVKLRNWQTTFNWQPTEARIESQASINDTGHLGANIQLFPVEGGWRQAEIDGYVRLQLNEWMLSEQLTRQFELTRTQLDWQTLVMGSLNDIQHNSRALVDIDFNLALLELKNQNLSLQADIANESLHAFGLWRQQGLSTNPREARIHLQAAPLNTQAKLKLDISTESMEIVRTPFAHLFLGADMQLQLDQAGAVLRGEARIHDSYLDLDKMPLHQRTSVNTDEIIITREGEEVRHEKGLGFPLDYSLTLTLGDNVRLNVREAQAYLGGALTLAQTPEMEDIQALGEVRIESGYVELDRRNRINFDPSSFSFTGNLDNPRLNVNLFRHVDRTTARLNITGTSTQPQFVFYANPAQSQARIINLLIFGRAGDLENEPNYQSQILTAFYKLGIQNNTPVLNRLTRTLGVEDIYFDVQDQQVSSLLLGRALTNDIYIRYAHDLSGGQNNAVQIFYQLTPRWLLKSDNRGDRSSVDLIFQQERD